MIVYPLLSTDEGMVAEGQPVEHYEIMSGGVLKMQKQNGDLLYLSPGEWRRLFVPGKVDPAVAFRMFY